MIFRPTRLIFILGLLLLIAACSTGRDDIEGDVTPKVVAAVTEPAPVQPTDTPPPPAVVVTDSDNSADSEEDDALRPDLVVGGVSIDSEQPVTCLPNEGLALGLKVWVTNGGSLPVGPFELTVNGDLINYPGEIVPGDTAVIWVGQYAPQAIVELDPNQLIDEVDESNNRFDQPIPVPTPPIACTSTPQPAPAAEPVNAIDLEWVADGFARPLFVTHAADDRLFVVEQQGTIRTVSAAGEVSNTPFLNIIDRTNSSRNEQGLLGLAFHPNYQNTGRFFVNYTHADGSTVVSEFSVSADPNVADAGSERQILKIGQPYANHNGGMIAFGPDGYLYIGMGDGGSQNDPENRAQDLNSLLGKILRIDVNSVEPYGIPADNPFVGDDSARNEIWSYGWRNPWRFSFDAVTNEMYVGDVGQNEIEEISLNPNGIGGLNFGWRIYEGNECYLDDCSTAALQPAIAQYGHVDGHCSITGGIMHRGSQSPALYGNYFFADYCSSQMWRLFPSADGSFEMAALSQPGFLISSFGEDVNGEIYIVNQNGGEIYKIVPTN